MNNKFIYKIYTNSGTYIKSLSIRLPVQPSVTDTLVLNTPRIISEINGGQGEMRIDLDDSFDDFDEGNSIALNNIIKLYEVDNDTNSKGKLLFTGIIQAPEPFLNGNKEGVTIIAISRIAELSKAHYKSSGNITFTKSGLTASELFEDILDHFNTVYTSTDINYTGGSVDATAIDINYDFDYIYWREAIDIALASAPDGYYYYIDPDGTAYFKDKPSTSTHTFITKRHIENLILNKSMEPIVNQLFLTWASGTTTFSDATSIAKYGLCEKHISDTNINDTNTRDERGNSYISKHKDPLYRVKTLIINNSYDISSLKPGDTIKILGLKKGSSPLIDNLQIVRVEYNGTTASLILEDDFLNFAKTINQS